MRQTKRIFVLLLTVVMIATVIALPASADDFLESKFESFPQQSTSSYSSGYTGAVQIYLASISDHTMALINSSGRIDGVYGGKTAEAVKWVQEHLFFPGQSNEWDGVCGSKTWKKIGAGSTFIRSETDSDTGHTYAVYYVQDNDVYRTRSVGTRTEYSYYNLWGGNWTIFRTA